MLKFIKSNKLFSLLLIITIITIIIGLLIPSLFTNKIKISITNNLNNYIDLISNNRLNFNLLLKDTLISNYLYIGIIWLLGISIIGIPIILFLYLTKVVIVPIELVFLIKSSKINIIVLILYFVPKIIEIFLIFLLVYYAYSFSNILIRVLFFNKKNNLREITIKYIKVFIVIIILISINTIINDFIITNIIKYFL